MKQFSSVLFSGFLLCYLFSITLSFNAAAQRENNHWHFGENHHIDFNAVPPVYAANSSMLSNEACATVSDAQGNLLFYTMGSRIWDRNGNEMPNATGLLGNGPLGLGGLPGGSSLDGVQVLPHPGNPDQYYVFSGAANETGTDILYYHLVDMSLNNGLGDVVSTEKNVVLLPGVASEYTTTAYGSCTTVWFIAITKTNTYHAYKIDQNGLDMTPVISTQPFPALPGLFYTKITADGIAYTNTGIGLLRSVFDVNTGMFSNYELMNDISPQIFELSPDNQKLYGSGVNQFTQWDLSLYPNIPAIAASAVNLAPVATGLVIYYSFRLGPDGKIYVIRLQTINTLAMTSHADVINQPTAAGAAAAYSPLVFNLQQNPNGGGGTSFGARFVALRLDTVARKLLLDTIICKQVPLSLSSPYQNARYYWSDGSQGQSISVDRSGTYYVYTYAADCKLYVDSFSVAYDTLSVNLGNDTVLCAGAVHLLDATQPGATAYLWQDGSVHPQMRADKTGKYFVTVSNGACHASDTLNIEVKVPAVDILQADTFICEQDQLILKARSNFESEYSWSTGGTGNTITIDQPGVYVVTAQNKCGTQTDSVQVEQVNCACVPTFPNAFTPNGDGKNDVFLPLLQSSCIPKSYELLIYNRYGQIVFSTNQNGVGWDGTYLNGRTAEIGVYYVVLKITNAFGNVDTRIHKSQFTLLR